MTDPDIIVRVAAKGDGVTADGRHFPQAAPGDRIEGTVLVPGPHHAVPPCHHFGTCGGCQLQHLDEDSLRDFVTQRVVNAAQGQGLAPGEVLPTHLSPPRTRRRATLHAQRIGKRVVLGFREAGSHRLVDLTQCHILRPELFALLAPLRRLLASQEGRMAVDVDLTLTDQGVDCSLRNVTLEGLAAIEAALDFARDHALVRLSIDQGYGPEAMWEPEPVTQTFCGVPVAFPQGAFLQATSDGEQRLLGDARCWLEGCGKIADLFSGLGTFAFAMPDETSVLAAEAARDAHLACKAAAARSRRNVACVHRDLYRSPLRAEEMAGLDAVILDPPRAGAREQVDQIAASDVAQVVYVSCNPSSWARDAQRLAEAGFRIEAVRAVGQFRWSTHVELTSLLVR